MKILQDIHGLTVNTVIAVERAVRFGLVAFGFYVAYKLLLEQFLDGSKQILPLFALWVLTSYIVLPRIHRMLTGYYVPNYFVGRVRSPSGLLSDPVNLAFIGSEDDLHRAMQKAGWTTADKLSIRSIIKTLYAAILHRSYPNAPVGNMYLFNRRHDFAYQQEVGGSPNERHHVRFWQTPDSWYLPGGHKADWLAAATYDTKVGIKLATGQLDHYIHANSDEERDYIMRTLKRTKSARHIKVISHFTDAYHDRSNGGDRIKTDGSLPFISL